MKRETNLLKTFFKGVAKNLNDRVKARKTEIFNHVNYKLSDIPGPPVITLHTGTLHSFSLLPPNINSASVTVLTQSVVLSTNLAGRWQLPDNSLIASNNLTFSTFHVTQGGLYRFFVNNWDGHEVLAIQIGITSEGQL